MDRDRRWERTKLAYDAIVHAEGLRAASAAEAVADAYERGETDEFIRPTVIGDYDGIADGDVAIHFNFRPDRARQLVPRARRAATSTSSTAATRPELALTTLTEYQDELGLPGRVPAARARDDAGRGARRARRAPAPRRRDREVRARHLLLQRRPRARVGGGGALPGRLAARRPHLRPQARDERRARPPRPSASAGPRAATASGSSTSPTPTWSATPASSRPRSTAVEAVDALPRRGGRGGARRAAAPASSPPTTATPSNMLEPDGSPNTAHSLNPVPFVVTVAGHRARRRRRSSPTSPRPRSTCSGSSSRRR